MGMAIVTWPMKRVGESLVEVPVKPELFDWREYYMFGLFAHEMGQDPNGPSISKARGLPTGMPTGYRYDCENAVCATWVTALELATFDYDQIVACENESLGECLGSAFSEDLKRFLLCRADLLVVSFWH